MMTADLGVACRGVLCSSATANFHAGYRCSSSHVDVDLRISGALDRNELAVHDLRLTDFWKARESTTNERNMFGSGAICQQLKYSAEHVQSTSVQIRSTAACTEYGTNG